MKIRDDYTCPLEIVHDIIKGKWKTIILYQMKDCPKGLAELEREIEGITQKMIEAITIMQMVGVDYMIENGMTDALIEKGILSKDEVCKLVKEVADG